MLEIDIDNDMLSRAEERAKLLPVLNNSIRDGKGSLVAYLGEEIVKKVYSAILADTYDFDLISKDGLKIEVKTKERTVAPKSYYECSVANFNTSQKCDIYAFVSILNTLQKGWFLGSISKEDFFKQAIFHKAGEVDTKNNFVFRADCHNISISKLKI